MNKNRNINLIMKSIQIIIEATLQIKQNFKSKTWIRHKQDKNF